MDIYLHNTLSNKKELFRPIKSGEVAMYNCGPTVYGRQHLGNLSMFVFTDILRRTLEYAGFEVKQVVNITDFGHLTSDNDEGEDKMTKGLKAEGLEVSMDNMKTLARKYADIFLSDISDLNIKIKDTKFPFASDYIEEQIKLIEKLEEKGFTYRTSDGIYFDTGKFKNYGKLGRAFALATAGKETSRVGENLEKKSQRDFALWKFNPDLGWDSKWGKGFPGWHIECTAMVFELLGEQIDIHTGGIEHIPVHHNNEIAQAEAASGKSPFSRFWLHREHLQIEDEKISKSVGNVLYLSDLKAKKIHPLSFRYWLLTSRYNTPTNFTWEAVEGAQVALEKIVAEYFLRGGLRNGSSRPPLLERFEEAIADNLNTPVTIALLQEAKSREEIDVMDKILGLNIKVLAEQIQQIPDEIKDLQKQRDAARKNEDWRLSDDLRDRIESKGFIVKDLSEKTLILRSLSSLI